ncbi:MAG TPA: hypothetical protein DGG94_10680 [Micromonosporaceae bacterium]|nr:hypothetical protein [Micromonosporaceae bacterium]HCU50244.1 hypothetical protein [Micromonosporaceae bacterium]
MTTEPHNLVADTVAALESMPAVERAASAMALIAAVQGNGDRRIARIWWAAITELYEQGMSQEEIAARLDTSLGTVDLAVQSHRRTSAARINA